MNNFVIAIDGTSSSGKSTIAKAVAEKLNLIHIDSGAMYRAVTLFAIENNIYTKNGLDTILLIDSLKEILIDFRKNADNGINEVYLNNKNVEQEIREEEISKKVSSIAKIYEVRNFLTKIQRSFAIDKSIVMDGRDIGTNVFPNSAIKFYITSSIEIRAKRRFNQLNNKTTLEEVTIDLIERDLIDSTRKDSPLKKAIDAIGIDNSINSKEETINEILEIIAQKLNIS
ncbi:MAG: (d)CMP kinase [Solirubrobacteraceae bacterium]